MYCYRAYLMILEKYLEVIMLKAFAVKWLEKDETVINYTDEFESEHWVLKADILKDAISDLTDKYHQVLIEEQDTRRGAA